jgi:hypothetical protein
MRCSLQSHSPVDGSPSASSDQRVHSPPSFEPRPLFLLGRGSKLGMPTAAKSSRRDALLAWQKRVGYWDSPSPAPPFEFVLVGPTKSRGCRGARGIRSRAKAPRSWQYRPMSHGTLDSYQVLEVKTINRDRPSSIRSRERPPFIAMESGSISITTGAVGNR